jgi:hypothetical protein
LSTAKPHKIIFLLSGIFFLVNFSFPVFSQTVLLKGKVSDEKGEPLHLADVVIDSEKLHALTDDKGYFSLTVPVGKKLELKILYKGKIPFIVTISTEIGKNIYLDIKMKDEVLLLDPVIIQKEDPDKRREVSSFKIDPKIPKYLPSAFNDFNKILVTLPGVSSNSELTSQYNVRGGNFDENLVYVNGIEIYRPFLVKAGQQEGLSFINPDLVRDIEFSAGGWQAKYGDKLSSVLSVNYKIPYRFKASASAGLLGGTFHLENISKNNRFSYIIGARQKTAQYLLNTLPVKGEYRPRFFDIQSYLHIKLSKPDKYGISRTNLGLLTSFARNRYFILPSKRETTFGTTDEVIKLAVDFEGREYLEYETFQSALKLEHSFSDQYRSEWMISGVMAGEREYGDVEAAYKLCDVDPDPNSSQFNQCIFTRGFGSLFNHARNRLLVRTFNFTNHHYFIKSRKNGFQFGMSAGYENIRDSLSEYSFIDSLGYVSLINNLKSSMQIESFRFQSYGQHSLYLDSTRQITYGVRLNYWTLNNQLLVSPRIQYSWKPQSRKDIIYKASIGLYQQPPFYRELRDFEGNIHRDLKAQSSVHLIAGRDMNFKAWGRDFKFSGELWGKYLWNVIPYDIDNVRIRYYAHNNAKAYAGGADFRINGEFVKGAESWFSLGIISTREDVEGDGRGFIRRPVDQRVTAAIFFQDHLPNNPSIRAYLNLVYGTGLPFGPPSSVENRAVFSAPSYRRVDLGFSKLLNYTDKDIARKTFFESVWISAEVLNLLGVNNTISYLWISDVNRNQYAVPNTLSTRFVNVRIVAVI